MTALITTNVINRRKVALITAVFDVPDLLGGTTGISANIIYSNQDFDEMVGWKTNTIQVN